MNLNNVLVHAREMRFVDKSDDDLQQMLITCGNHTGQSSDLFTANQIPHAVKMIHEEMARRQRAKNQSEGIAEQQKLHQASEKDRAKLHTETLNEVGKVKTAVDILKTSVDHLARPRGIDWAILIVGAIAAIAAVIAIFK